MTWPRTLLLAFRRALSDVLEGRAESIPERLLEDVRRAAEDGVVTDPNGEEVRVDARTRVRLGELLADVSRSPAT